MSCAVYSGKQHLWQREEHVQRPWDRDLCGMFMKQQGSPCEWSRVSEGERRGGEDKGTGQVVQGLVGLGMVGLYPGRVSKQLPLVALWMIMAFISRTCYKN